MPSTSESAEENPGGGPQPPWNSIPKFIPGTTNVQEYVQKLRFLASLWPKEHLEQLAPRAALLVEGSAFKKVARLDPEKLRVKSTAGIALLVDAIGGSWGSTELEERYEFFEKSLYGTIQRSDESHDSYLSRFEANFTELISRGTKLEEVQAYILLRQSTLPPEDKKKILLENSGTLEYKPVVKSFRLLGSKFFHEFQSGKVANKTKVYDINMVEPSGFDSTAASSDSWSERAFHAISDDGDMAELEPEFIEAMLAQEDSDALTVSAFESELEEFMQETPEMYDAMVTYLEARTRLQEKRRTRGFWPVKGGGRSFKSKGKGKGKKGKESLLNRIARSRCRLCNELGHWKAECPRRNEKEAQSHDSANVAVAVGPFEMCSEPAFDASFAEVSENLPSDEDVNDVEFCVEPENAFVSFPAFHRNNDSSLASRMQRFVQQHKSRSLNKKDNCTPACPAIDKGDNPLKTQSSQSGRLSDRRSCEPPNTAIPMFRFERPALLKDGDSKEGAFIASDHFGTHAILDTGASRCIIGEKTLKALQSQLSDSVVETLRKTRSQVKFRFGNNQFLTSEYRIHFPLQRENSKPLWLAVEVVPGSTPFLFSKRAFKSLGGVLNTVRDSCILHKMSPHEIKLAVGPTDLYLLDIGSLCNPVPDHDTVFHKEESHAYVGEVNHQGEIDDKGPKNIVSLKTRVSHNVSDITVAHVDTKCPTKHISCVSRFAKHAGLRCFPQIDCRSNHSVAHTASSSDGQSVGTAQCGDRDQCPGKSRDKSATCPSDDRASKSTKPARELDSGTRSTSRTDESIHNTEWNDGVSTSGDFQQCQDWSDAHIKNQSTGYGDPDSDRVHSSKCGVDPGRTRGGKFPTGSWFSSRRNSGPSSSGLGGRHDSTTCCPSTSTSEPGPCISKRDSHADSPGMGSENYHLGQEAQGKILCADHDLGSRIPELVPSPIQFAATGSARFCSIRPDVSLSQCMNDPTMMMPNMQEIRNKLNQPPRFSRRFKKIDRALEASVHKAEEVLDQSFVKSARNESTVRSICLLEIYAGDHSPLTEAINHSDFKAIRFTRSDGDLSTITGRQKLWNLIEKHQPDHIWVAPECGPWGGWNRLNMFKSPSLFDSIQQKQFEQLPHVRLCAKICEYQHRLGRHFHLEQPIGSNMRYLPEFKPIAQVTLRAVFDMCRFGLKIPNSNRFIRKSSQVFTTSQCVFQSLDHTKCRGQHEHQRIEGSFNISGKSQRVSHFCATYCRGFADFMAKLICNRDHSFVSSSTDAFVNHDSEDERPNKRLRFTGEPNKRFKFRSQPSGTIVDDLDPETPVNPEDNVVNPNENPEGVSNESDTSHLPAVDQSTSWPSIFNLAEQVAPRVGNLKIEVSSELFREFQKMLPDMCVESLFVCRGTERLQVPIGSPVSSQFPLRKTISIHRQTGEIHETEIEDWHNMTRSRRIRSHVPSKIMLTAFGTKQEASPVRLPEACPDAVPESEPPSACRANPKSFDVSRRTTEVPEGWAPPPVPLHGPLFRNLSSQEKQDLVKLHKNLGHPDPQKLAQHLENLGASPHIVAASREYVCDTCVESSHTKHQRPSQIHDAREFNELVGIDGFYWTGKRGFQVNIFHCVDEASLFHLGRRLENRHVEHVIPVWTQFWHSWAGNPVNVYSDPAGEFCSDQWLDQLQAWGTTPRMSTEAWQKGRVERHGQIIKRMLTRYDIECPIENVQEFDVILQACFQAKNALTQNGGYSPEQIVLGKASRIPASLTSDEDSGSHSLAIGQDLASEKFRRLLDIRARARQAFLHTDNDQAFRRALLRKSCPMRGPYQKGQTVMYWHKKTKANRQEAGRWHGPATVICQEGLSIVWVSHANRLIRCAPESLRPASLREWNSQVDVDKLPPPELSIGQEGEQASVPPFELDQQSEYAPTTPEAPVIHPTSPTSVNPSTGMQPESEIAPNDTDDPTQVNSDLQPPHHPQLPVSSEHVPVAPEPPPPLELETDDELIVENVLHCHPVDIDSNRDQLMEWTIESKTEPSGDIFLAEDDLPLLKEPLTCNSEQCFVLEVPMTRSDILQWSQADQPEEMASVASASKRARSEVHIKDLTAKERALFDIAKDAELTCWIQTNALKPVLRKYLNPEQILRSRWVLTWKPTEDDLGNISGKKAKARLVVLGFQDPNLTEVQRDAPTLTKEGRSTILQMIASFQWELSSFDIKTAFLRGKADEKNPLAMEPPPELRKKLQLQDNQVCQLVGNAYGRVDAPLLFFKELRKHLQELQFKVHPLEPCLYYLESQHNGVRKIHGVLGTHVDDGLCGGDDWFHQQIHKLKEKLPFGSFKTRKFTFTGIQLEQLPDFSIKATQGDYVKAISAIDVGKSRREVPEAPVTDSEMTKLRGLIGSMQYAVSHTRPDLASRLGEIQVQLSKPTVSTLLQGNKLLREAQISSDVSVFFRNIPSSQITHVAFGDASFASPKQLASFQGSIICATSPKMLQNERAPVSPLTWSSKKINRVVRSTLSAEAFSMSRSVDQLGWMRLLWGTLAISDFNWRQPLEAFPKMHPAAIVTDCKSLYDLVSRTAMPSCEEYRTTLEVLLIRERCLEHCVFRWIPTSLQLADALTKVMDTTLLRTVMASGLFQLHDEQVSLEKNAQKKQAISWLREQSQSRQQ